MKVDIYPAVFDASAIGPSGKEAESFTGRDAKEIIKKMRADSWHQDTLSDTEYMTTIMARLGVPLLGFLAAPEQERYQMFLTGLEVQGFISITDHEEIN